MFRSQRILDVRGPDGPVASSDAALIELSVREPDVFAILFDRHAVPLLRYFYARTYCHESSADLVAETFAEAFASRGRFRDVGAPGHAWLMQIASRQLSRYQRRASVAARYRRRLGISDVVMDDADLERVERLVDAEAVRSRLFAALDSLPADQSAAVDLRVLQGFPYSEVAAMAGCTEGAARVRVSRGLTRLLERMTLT